MSLRGEDLNAYLSLVDQCAALGDECSRLYESTLAEIGTAEWVSRDQWEAKWSEYMQASARRDRLYAKLLREDWSAALVSIAASNKK